VRSDASGADPWGGPSAGLCERPVGRPSADRFGLVPYISADREPERPADAREPRVGARAVREKPSSAETDGQPDPAGVEPRAVAPAAPPGPDAWVGAQPSPARRAAEAPRVVWERQARRVPRSERRRAWAAAPSAESPDFVGPPSAAESPARVILRANRRGTVAVVRINQGRARSDPALERRYPEEQKGLDLASADARPAPKELGPAWEQSAKV
jgi:hypothetical protein